MRTCVWRMVRKVHNRAIARLELPEVSNATHWQERPRMALPNNGSVIVADSVRKTRIFRHQTSQGGIGSMKHASTPGSAKNVEGYKGPLRLQFKGGQSTRPTGWIRRAFLRDAAPAVGKLLPSAHAVDREFRVITALNKQGFRLRRPMHSAPTTASSVPPSTSCRWRGPGFWIPRC
jgi:hypothetical protein